jgi:N-glycosylase/DNA lyase
MYNPLLATYEPYLEGDYVGVIGERVVSMRQVEGDVLYRVHCRPSPRGRPRGGQGFGFAGEGGQGERGEVEGGEGEGGQSAASGTRDAAAVADYFNLNVSLEALSENWAAADDRFKKLEPFLPGAGARPIS